MGKKLSEEQKAANHEANKARSRAFHARRKEYDQARTVAAARPEVVQARQAAEQADKAMSEAMAARDAALADIEAQIAALRDKSLAVGAQHDAIIQPLKQARTESWNRAHAATKKADNEVKAEFPDVADCFSPVCWKSLEEFLPDTVA